MFTIFNLISSTFKFSSETKQQQGDEEKEEEEKIVHRRRKGCRTGIDMVGVSPMCVCVSMFLCRSKPKKE